MIIYFQKALTSVLRITFVLACFLSSMGWSGGADISGGEGQRSQIEQLETVVYDSLAELPLAFLRLKTLLASEAPDDQVLMQDLIFMKPCLSSDEKTPLCSPFPKIEKIVETFVKAPNFQSEDCPATRTDHAITDMSINSELQLCVSHKLIRYPVAELKHQVVSLLIHEVTHAMGFDELLAQKAQNWYLTHRSYQFPSPFLDKYLEKNSASVSNDLLALARELSRPNKIDIKMACTHLDHFQKSFSDLHFAFTAPESESLIGIPASPIKHLALTITEDLKSVSKTYCNRYETDPHILSRTQAISLLGDLQQIISKLEVLQIQFSTYTFYLFSREIYPMTPDPVSSMALLLAQHDLTFPRASATKVLCTSKADTQRTLKLERRSESGDTYALPLSRIMNPDLFKDRFEPSLLFYVAQNKKTGGMGILMHLEINPTFRPDNDNSFFETKMIETNADSNRVYEFSILSPMLLKVLGHDTEFKTTFQLIRKTSKDSSPFGPPITVSCTIAK